MPSRGGADGAFTELRPDPDAPAACLGDAADLTVFRPLRGAPTVGPGASEDTGAPTVGPGASEDGVLLGKVGLQSVAAAFSAVPGFLVSAERRRRVELVKRVCPDHAGAQLVSDG